MEEANYSFGFIFKSVNKLRKSLNNEMPFLGDCGSQEPQNTSKLFMQNTNLI